MKNLFNTYRVLAYVVGVLLAFAPWSRPAEVPRRPRAAPAGVRRDPSILWVLHGWVFMVYVVVAFLLARKAGWTIGFTVLMFVAGLIPLLIFWVERRVARKVRAENPELTRGPSLA